MSDETRLYLKSLKRKEPTYSDEVFLNLLEIMDGLQKEGNRLSEILQKNPDD